MTKEELALPVPKGRGLDRAKAFSDGVFAIVITILVLTIEVPDGYDFEKHGLKDFFLDLESMLRPYFASFLLVAVYWSQHVIIFHYARYSTRTFAWLNTLFLLPVTLVPFVAAFHAKYPGEPIAIITFGLTQIACFGGLLILWHYVAERCRSGMTPIGSRERHSMTMRLFMAIGLVTASVLVAMWNERMGLFVFMVVPCLFFSHRVVDDAIARDPYDD